MEKQNNASMFLRNTSLRLRIAALLVLGAGPFACREWNSLAILTLLSVFIGFSRSVRGVYAVCFGFLVAILFYLVDSSSFLVSHPELKGALVVFSAYGVALYGLSVIAPHLNSEEFLQGSRTAYRPLRGILVRICHVVVLFLRGHSGIIGEVVKNLRVAGVSASILRPIQCLKYLNYFLTSLWLYVLVHSAAYSIALDTRLVPWLDEFRKDRIRLTPQSVVVSFITAISGYIVFMDFVTGIFKASP